MRGHFIAPSPLNQKTILTATHCNTATHRNTLHTATLQRILYTSNAACVCVCARAGARVCVCVCVWHQWVGDGWVNVDR